MLISHSFLFYGLAVEEVIFLVHVLGSTPIALQPTGIEPATEGSRVHLISFAIVLNLLYIALFEYIVLQTKDNLATPNYIVWIHPWLYIIILRDP